MTLREFQNQLRGMPAECAGAVQYSGVRVVRKVRQAWYSAILLNKIVRFYPADATVIFTAKGIRIVHNTGYITVYRLENLEFF